MSESSTEPGAGFRPAFDLGLEEDELLARHFAGWLRVGLSTEPADFERTEELLRRAYRLAGVEPLFFVRVKSPHEALRGLRMFGRIRTVRVPLPGPARKVLSQRERVPTPIRPAWTFFLWHGLLGSVDRGFHRPVWRAAYRDVNGEEGVPLPPHGALGQTDVPRVAYDRFFEELGFEAGSRPSERLALREALARSCGWVWEFEHGGLCVISERPAEIHTETTEGAVRMHREDGPAVTFRDGAEIWAWHGVAVPRAVVEDPASLTPEEIRREEDPDVRRVMLERFGLFKYLDMAGGPAVDWIERDAEGVPAGLRGAMLVKAPWWGGPEQLTVLSLVDAAPESSGTPRRHWIRVPPEMGTVREAVAWTFGLEAKEYAPHVET